MFDIRMTCYPWDLVDEGVDEVLDRLKGEAGVTGICLAAAYPAVAQLRPHESAAPRTFRSTGGLLFQPGQSSYPSTRLRPAPAAWIRKSNPLATVLAACETRGLSLRAWMVACHNPALVDRHEHAAVKDMFGDINPNWVCPSNPDVREYLRLTIEDLTRHHRVQALELDQFGFPAGPLAHAHDQAGVVLGPVEHWLLSLCFCESCRQAGMDQGVDVAAAARSAAVTLSRVFGGGERTTETVGEFVAADPILRGFVEWRCRQVTSLVAAIRKACKIPLVLRLRGDAYHGGCDYPTMVEHCDGLVIPDLPPDDDLEPAVRVAAALVGDAGKVDVELLATAPACTDSAALVRSVTQAVRAGVASVNIANYGLMPLARLQWVKQAARYAQREAGV